MPIVKCPNPNCNATRLVVEGKRKKCRKCGTPMTTIPPKAPKTEKLTADDLRSRYPVLVAEIVKTAQVEALVEAAGQEDELDAMKRPQLRERAVELDIVLPLIITNETIRNLIREKLNVEKSADDKD